MGPMRVRADERSAEHGERVLIDTGRSKRTKHGQTSADLSVFMTSA